MGPGPVLTNLKQHQKEVVQHSITVFVTSTTGQGDVPANASVFWKSLLRKKLPPTCLSQLHFTTFGLGDSSYPKCDPSLPLPLLASLLMRTDRRNCHRFNWAVRKLQKRLLQLGAAEVYASGEGDERHDHGYVRLLPLLFDLLISSRPARSFINECPPPPTSYSRPNLHQSSVLHVVTTVF